MLVKEIVRTQDIREIIKQQFFDKPKQKMHQQEDEHQLRLKLKKYERIAQLKLLRK